jgi:RNA polymerase sigma-70 factor (ECF subfamily)
MAASDLHLSCIATQWTLVRQAHHGGGDEARPARQELLELYGGAVRRYLLGALRDPHAAADLFQEFACQLLNGDLRGADPARGRFRDYVKGMLSHLLADHYRQQRRRPDCLTEEPPAAGPDDATAAEEDRAFQRAWRTELLARAWAGLAALEAGRGNAWYSVLHLHVRHPQLRSPELAELCGARLGTAMSAVAVRQALHRARAKFAELLLYEVRQSLERPTRQQLEEELVELGLYEYCRPALELAQRRGSGGPRYGSYS